VPMRNLAKWSVQLPGLAEPSPANETVSVTSRWRGSDCVWWPFAVARVTSTVSVMSSAPGRQGVTTMTDRSTTTAHAGIRAFVARRPVTAFLIMAFAIAYAPS